jgi:hypothetical protein
MANAEEDHRRHAARWALLTNRQGKAAPEARTRSRRDSHRVGEAGQLHEERGDFLGHRSGRQQLVDLRAWCSVLEAVHNSRQFMNFRNERHDNHATETQKLQKQRLKQRDSETSKNKCLTKSSASSATFPMAALSLDDAASS